jgi:hypothetical protein
MASDSVPAWTPYVSVAAFVVALTGLAWQLWLFRLSGARLQVRLMAAFFLVDGSMLFQSPVSGWPKGGPAPRIQTLVGKLPAVHLAVVEVINVGRSPVSVSQVALDFGPIKVWRPWDRWYYSTPLVPLLHGKAAAERDVYEPIRLEAGEQYTAIMFIGYPEPSHLPKSVRATARPAGRRARRSSWRHRWRSGIQVPQFPWMDADPIENKLLEIVFPLLSAMDISKLNATYADILEQCQQMADINRQDIEIRLRAALGEADADHQHLWTETIGNIEELAPGLRASWEHRALTGAVQTEGGP